jgi:hypothetical protein
VPIAPRCALALAALLPGCQSGTLTNNQSAEAAPTPAAAELTGYGRVRFGMSFNEVLADIGGDPFNPSSIVSCARDMPLRGCFLAPNRESAAPFAMRDGIPYMLDVSFNRLDHLTDIGLSYERESGITEDECLQLSGRTLDWLTRDYGAFQPQGHGRDEGRVRQVRTPAGNTLPVLSTPNQGFIITMIADLHGGRRVDLLAIEFPIASDPHCRIAINLGEPQNVERRDLSEH